MRQFLILVFVLMAMGLSAQQLDSLSLSPLDSTTIETEIDTDSSFFLPTHLGEYGGYFELFNKIVPGPGGNHSLRQLGVGLSLKRLTMGAHYSQVDLQYEKQLVFPNYFELNYTYGGFFLGTHVIQKKPIEIDARANYSMGDMIWNQNESPTAFLRDKFQVLEPEILINYVPFTYLKIFVSGGYRYIHELNIPGVSTDDFNGFVFGFGFRLGYYK